MTTELKQAAQQSTLCLQAVCRYISDVLAGDASSSEKHIARTIMHLLPLEQAVPIQQAEARQPDNAACKSVQKRLAAQQPATGEPVYWEWRHLSTHPDTVDFGKWSEWKRVEARSAIHTIEDALAEFRAYIAQGYKYELRALYDHPAPSVPDDDFDLICNAIDKADSITMEGDYMLDSDDCIAVVRVMQVLLSVRAAMLAT